MTGAAVALSRDPGSWNTTYSSTGPIAGYRPYADGYPDPPVTVWGEGSWGAALLMPRLGQDVTADLRSLERLQAADPAGGVLQVSTGRAAAPYELHAWPSVAATGWAALVSADAGLLWRPDGWPQTSRPG